MSSLCKSPLCAGPRLPQGHGQPRSHQRPDRQTPCKVSAETLHLRLQDRGARLVWGLSVCPAIFLKLTPRIPLPQALSPQGPQCPSAVLSRLCWKFPRQAGHRLNNQLFPLLPEQRSLPSTWSDPSSPFTAGLLSIHAASPPESQCLLFLHSLLLFSLHPTQLSR